MSKVMVCIVFGGGEEFSPTLFPFFVVLALKGHFWAHVSRKRH